MGNTSKQVIHSSPCTLLGAEWGVSGGVGGRDSEVTDCDLSVAASCFPRNVGMGGDFTAVSFSYRY